MFCSKRLVSEFPSRALRAFLERGRKFLWRDWRVGKSAKQCKRFPILLLLISLELPPVPHLQAFSSEEVRMWALASVQPELGLGSS